MSNIYIQEPPSNGKVLLTTSVGEIDIELWSKEAPKACRNFVQLCMEGYYNDTVFHRVIKEFIAQGGDPTGTGDGGESIYGAPFKDEFHSRLRFVRRGLVAMANAGKDDNGSQFFFTMGPTQELQNKHTIFGKVAGNTVFNMIRLQDVETDDNDRPYDPHKILKTEVLLNPFDNIVPRQIKKGKKDKDDERKVKSKSKATKNFSLLSFGEEAEEDEEETFKASKKFSGKSKSSHDLIDDPRLSSVPVVDKSGKRKLEDSEENQLEAEDLKLEIRKKLKEEKTEPKPIKEELDEFAIERQMKKEKREEARREAKQLQKEIKASKKKAEAAKLEGSKKNPEGEMDASLDKDITADDNDKDNADFLTSFKMERQKYKNLKQMQKSKGKGREQETLAMLSKFQSSLTSVKQVASGYSDSEPEEDESQEKEEEDSDNLSWMNHKLKFDEKLGRKVLDANIHDIDQYEIHDPRNPMTQRRRESSKKKLKSK